MSLIFINIWAWVKKYWWILLFPLGILFLFFKYGKTIIQEILEISRQSNDLQKQELERIEKERLAAQAEVKKIYDNAIIEIDKQYSEDLTENKELLKKEMKELAEKYKNDPKGLARAFADEFGIKFVD